VLFVFEPSPVLVGIPAVMRRRLKRLPLLFWVQDLWPESLQDAVFAAWSPPSVESFHDAGAFRDLVFASPAR
jgi:hypothetical protein